MTNKKQSNENTKEVIVKMEELNKTLHEAADAYYNDDTEIMSNFEYDALYDELVKLEDKFGILLDDSITQKVGSELSSTLPKIKHDFPMLSLSKTKSRDEIVKWLGKHVGCLSWKLDGSTVVLTYDKGYLFQAVTRGNGIVGEDVTEQAQKFAMVPQKINFDGKLVIRGEAIMTYSEFERVNAAQPIDQRYKNPRNLASGTMRALDTSILEEREIEFHPFTLVSVEGEKVGNVDINSYSSRLDWLNSLGFSSVEHKVVDAKNVLEEIDAFENIVEKQDIPSDGLVLFFDDVQYGESLGSTGHAPRNGIAFKWNDETAETNLKEIVWQTSRTGRVNPVAVFEPVELEGTTVERATLNNLSFINDNLGVPYKGQVISVYKANKIIPTVLPIEKGSGKEKNSIAFPSKCPTCGNKLERQNEHGSEFLMCVNNECPARQESAYSHFCSRDALDINGISAKTIRKLVGAGIVNSFADLLRLPEHKDFLISFEMDEKGKEKAIYHLEGLKERSIDNLLNAITAAKNTTAAKFLYSLGIREIGKSASRDICAAYKNDVSAVIDDCVKNDADKITEIDGIGDIMVTELVEYMTKNENMVRELLTLVIIEDKGESVEIINNDFIEGKTFVVTGDVHVFSNRNALKDYVLERGGKVAGSVSKNTDYLITNTPDSGTSKNKKAQELGIPIITEDEFCAKAGIES